MKKSNYFIFWHEYLMHKGVYGRDQEKEKKGENKMFEGKDMKKNFIDFRSYHKLVLLSGEAWNPAIFSYCLFYFLLASI